MKDNLDKLRTIFRSPGLMAVIRWSKNVHKKVLLLSLVTVIITFFAILEPIATKGLVDGAVSADRGILLRYAAVLAVLIFLQHSFSGASARLRISASADLQRSMQSMLVKEILSKDYALIKGYRSGELVNRVFSDVTVVKGGVLNIFPGLISIVFSFFGAAVILIFMDWRFVILIAGGGLAGLSVAVLLRGPMKDRYKQMQKAEDSLHASAQEALVNIRLIKSSLSENKVIGRIEEEQQTLRDSQVKQLLFHFRINNGMKLAINITWLACMIWGCVNIYHGRMTYGSLAAMIQLVGYIQGPIVNAASVASELYSVISSAERILELVELPDEEPGERMTDFDEICLDNAAFRYEDGVEEVLQSVSHTIHKGDFMALTGISGGGKTSLFQLLLGIYQPTSGKILFRLGEQEVPASRGTRALFAYVPQGNSLFSGTLRENLTLFTDQNSEEEILQAVKLACLDHVVEEIGLDAVLGERGIGLSEGQAQRVAIARALLGKAPILLLDEATSALDEATEEKLLANISAMRDKTCIIVTHRKAALEICDYTMHLSDGKITRENSI